MMRYYCFSVEPAEGHLLFGKGLSGWAHVFAPQTFSEADARHLVALKLMRVALLETEVDLPPEALAEAPPEILRELNRSPSRTCVEIVLDEKGNPPETLGSPFSPLGDN